MTKWEKFLIKREQIISGKEIYFTSETDPSLRVRGLEKNHTLSILRYTPNGNHTITLDVKNEYFYFYHATLLGYIDSEEKFKNFYTTFKNEIKKRIKIRKNKGELK